MDLKIENMTCGGCAKSVTKAIQSVDPAAEIETNLATRAVKIETAATPSAILEVLEQAGYTATAN
ncbi:MAG: heavy-metal-associated domain-containing protein [Pannonibacter sp.]